MSDLQAAGWRQRGIALISVLLLLVFILTIVGGLFYRHQIHIQKVTRSLVGEQALLFLLSAEGWAQSVLVADGDNSATDHLREAWARALPAMPIEGGRISGCVRDLQGLFNINSLAGYSIASWEDEVAAEQLAPVNTTRRTLFRNLLQQLDLDSSDTRIAALVDWLDDDSWLVSADSAEDNEYLLLDPPYRAANQPLVELSELSLVQGFGPRDVVRLQPWVNTVAEEVPININTAPAQVLMALSPLITAEVAQGIGEGRPYGSVSGFYVTLAGLVGQTQQDLQTLLPAELVAVDSSYFSLLADVELAGVRMAYTSVIHRSGGDGARVLSRTLRPIPALADRAGEALAINTLCAQTEEAGARP
jgi:general secretion pathway protein K